MGSRVCVALFRTSRGRLLDQALPLLPVQKSIHLEAKRLLAEILARERDHSGRGEVAGGNLSLAALAFPAGRRALAAGVESPGEEIPGDGDGNISGRVR